LNYFPKLFQKITVLCFDNTFLEEYHSVPNIAENSSPNFFGLFGVLGDSGF
jgi:hypothetical protein